MIHIHEHRGVVALVKPHLKGQRFNVDGMNVALFAVARLIDNGAIDITHVTGCDACEHPMGHGHDHGFVFQEA